MKGITLGDLRRLADGVPVKKVCSDWDCETVVINLSLALLWQFEDMTIGEAKKLAKNSDLEKGAYK